MAANNSLYKLETTLNCNENSATNGNPVVTGSLISQRYMELFLVVCVCVCVWTVRNGAGHRNTEISKHRIPTLYVHEERNQLDATQWFIELMIRSTCFGHYYAHHQELEHPSTWTHNLQPRTVPTTSYNQGYVPHAVNICIVSSSWWWA